MSSSPEGEFLASFGGAILAAAVLSLLIMAVFFLPLLAIAAVPAVAYIYHRNSPQTKEREARVRTEELFRIASDIKPPNYDAHLDRIIAVIEDQAVRDVAVEIYILEGFSQPPPVPPICDSVEGARYRDKLHAYIGSAHDHKATDEFVDALIDCLPARSAGKGIFAAKRALSNDEVEGLIQPFYGYPDYFRELKKVFDRNLVSQKSVLPSAYKGDNCTFAYLKDTPLLALERHETRVGLSARMEHTQIVAGSGSGKTSLLEYMIHDDLDQFKENCVIVIDSQRQLIDKLARRNFWTDEVAYFSPHHKLGINLFDVELAAEEDVISVIDLMEYVMSGLMDAKLTSKQATLFNYAIQLLIAIPGANLASFRRLLRLNAKTGLGEFIPHLANLPNEARDFFENEFGQQGYSQTKEEIMWRIDAMLRNPAFARIFSATRNPIDMAEEMADRRLILIDTDVNHLGDAGSSFFGRFFIALILKAARQRFKGEHRPVYLYIDECAAYLDSRLELMLQQARKANIGVILAHQDLEKARSAGILSTILGNTATKFAGRLSDADARMMAANMRTSAEFIKDLPQYSFAMSSIREQTVAVTAETWRAEHADQRSNYDDLIAEMEKRYGPTVKVSPQPSDKDENSDVDSSAPTQPVKREPRSTAEPQAQEEQPTPTGKALVPVSPRHKNIVVATPQPHRDVIVDAEFESLDDDIKPSSSL